MKTALTVMTVLATLVSASPSFADARGDARAQVDFGILKYHLERELWLMENTSAYEDNPLVYNEYLTDSVYLLLTQSTLPKAKNLQNATARIAALPEPRYPVI